MTQDPQSASPVRPAPGAAALNDDPASAQPLYCSSCWSALPLGATSCPDCGVSLSEMEARRRQQAEADRRWVPDRQHGDEAPEAAAPGPDREPSPAPDVGRERAPAGSATVSARAELRIRRPQMLAGVLAAILIVGAWAAVILSALAVMAGSRRPPPQPARPAQAPPGSAASVPVRVDNPYPDFQFELRRGEEVVARFGGITPVASRGEAPAIPPGDYVLRITDRLREWSGRDLPVSASAGQVLTIAPPDEVVVAYYVFKARRTAASGLWGPAESAWKIAAETDPGSIEVRRGYAEALLQTGKIEKAGTEVEAALQMAPRDASLLRLKEQVEEAARREAGGL